MSMAFKNIQTILLASVANIVGEMHEEPSEECKLLNTRDFLLVIQFKKICLSNMVVRVCVWMPHIMLIIMIFI